MVMRATLQQFNPKQCNTILMQVVCHQHHRLRNLFCSTTGQEEVTVGPIYSIKNISYFFNEYNLIKRHFGVFLSPLTLYIFFCVCYITLNLVLCDGNRSSAVVFVVWWYLSEMPRLNKFLCQSSGRTSRRWLINNYGRGTIHISLNKRVIQGGWVEDEPESRARETYPADKSSLIRVRDLYRPSVNWILKCRWWGLGDCGADVVPRGPT